MIMEVLIERTAIPLEPYSFIAGYTIDPKLCDRMIEQMSVHKDKVTYSDDMRQYHRLVSTDMDKSVDTDYHKALQLCLKLYGEEYSAVFEHNLPWGISAPYNIQRYEPGSRYTRWHSESVGPENKKLMRILTFLTYLNDVETGGETEFLYQKIKVQPKKGLTLIWPAEWTHIHRGLPAADSVKYITNGWCVYVNRLG
jgi:hypothetical protein